MANTITPANSIIIIIGFLNIASTLKRSRGTKKSSFFRAASCTGYGSVTACAGESGVPGKYGRTSGMESVSKTSTRIYGWGRDGGLR